jgi:hypothetical protein
MAGFDGQPDCFKGQYGPTTAPFTRTYTHSCSSDRDFVSKMSIARREAKEARVAIRFITHCELENRPAIPNYEDEANQLASIFSAIVRNKKAHL